MANEPRPSIADALYPRKAETWKDRQMALVGLRKQAPINHGTRGAVSPLGGVAKATTTKPARKGA
jgi:hypothetical protein